MRSLCGCWAADPDKTGGPREVVAEQCAFPALHEAFEALAARLETATPEHFPNSQSPIVLSEFAHETAREIRRALAPPVPAGPFRPCMVVGCGLARSAFFHNPPYGGADGHHAYIQGPSPEETHGP